MSRVVCIGSANVDIILYVDKLAAGDDEKAVADVAVCSGGSAGNIASGLGRLGNIVSFFGNIGSDSYTKMLEEDFEKDGVDFSDCVRTRSPNNTVYCIVDSQGRRQMYAYNRVEFSADDFPDRLAACEFVVFSSLVKDGIVPEYAKIAMRAKALGAKIVLAPGSIFAGMGFHALKPLVGLCDYVILNAAELDMLGTSLLVSAPKVIVTNGSGAIRYFNCGHLTEFGVDAVDVVDSTGAGDCFVAAFMSALLANKPDHEAIKFASRAASLSVTKKGARAMPLANQIESVM